MTVPGGGLDVLNLATAIADQLNSLILAGEVLQTATDSFGGTSIPVPLTGPQTIHEIGLDGDTPYNASIPAGYNYVVYTGDTSSTLSGNNVEIISGTVGSSFVVTGTSTVAASGGNNTIAASGNYLISAGAGNDTIAGRGDGTLAGGLGANLMFAATGSNLIESIGQDTIVGGSGLTTVTSSGTSSIIFGSTLGGGLTVSISGALATISASNSDLSTTLAGSAALVFGGQLTPGTLSVTDAGSNDSISALGSATTVTASPASNNLFVFGGSAALTFFGSSSAATILGGSSTNSIVGGTGGVLFGSEGNDTVVGTAPGGATIFGTANHEVTYLGNGPLLYAAGAGNETLNAAGSTGPNDLFAVGSGNASIIGGAATNLFDAGAGSDTFTGGAGSNTYFFLAENTGGAGNHDFVTNLSSTDAVGLIDYNPAASSIAVANGSSTLTLSDKTQITFVNVTDITNNIHYGHS